MNFTVLHDNFEFDARIRYVFDFIQNHPLAGGNIAFDFIAQSLYSPTIQYLSKNESSSVNAPFFIPAQKLIFGEMLSHNGDNLLISNAYTSTNFQLFSVEKQKKQVRPFFQNNYFGFDIVEAIFFHISRLEEHFCLDPQKDKHGRMKSSEQFLVRNRLEKLPIVDHLVYDFLTALGIQPKKLPTKKRLSFDVDILERYGKFPPFRSTIKYSFTKPSSVLKDWNRYLSNKIRGNPDPYFNFDWMLRERSDIEQAIYFLVNGTTNFDKPIPVIDVRFKSVVQLAKKRGLNIGIHPSYASWDSLELMEAEKRILESLIGEQAFISRQHFLHFSFETTPPILEKLGIESDSSIGFSDRIGFRCGTGFPYHLYNFQAESAWDFLEIPMVIMDVALIREAGNDWSRTQEIWNIFMDSNAFYTQITFNFHNSRFFDAELLGIDLSTLFEQI